MPVTLLAIGLNSPRILSGAFGLRSYMSCVGAPPSKYKRMTLLALAARACAPRFSSAASRPGKLKAPPRSDRAPAFRVSRRVRPSQRRRLLPSIVIMGNPPPELGVYGQAYHGDRAKQ